MKKAKKRAPSERERYARISERAFKLIVNTLTPAATKVFIFLCLRCNFGTGITHRFSYQEIGDECGGMHVRTVQRALHELDEHNLFNITDHGSVCGILPDQAMMQHYAHARRHERNIESFCDDLLKAIDQINEGRQSPIAEWRIYDKLRTERGKQRKFYPKEESYPIFAEKYADYLTPEADDADDISTFIDNFDPDNSDTS